MSLISANVESKNADCLLVWFLSFDLSSLVVPARGSHASAGWVLRIIETHKPLHHGKVAVHKRGLLEDHTKNYNQNDIQDDEEVNSIFNLISQW